MGQVLVILIRTDSTPEIVQSLRSEGFAVQQLPTHESWSEHDFRCGRDRRALRFSVYEDVKRPDTAFVVFPYPPYTLLPWRWPSDYRLFNDVTAVFEPFAIE